MTEIETDVRDTAEWHLFESVIVEAATALSGEDHDIAPLFQAMSNDHVRQGLLTYVLTEGDMEFVEDAMFHDGDKATEAMGGALRGDAEPSALLRDAYRYLDETVQWHPDVFDQAPEVKAHLWSAGAVIAFCMGDERRVHMCIDSANREGGTVLASLVHTAVVNGIRPAWVTRS